MSDPTTDPAPSDDPATWLARTFAAAVVPHLGDGRAPAMDEGGSAEVDDAHVAPRQILHVACGSGTLTRALAAHLAPGDRIIACSPDDTDLERASDATESRAGAQRDPDLGAITTAGGVTIDYRRGTWDDLPLDRRERRRTDVILSAGVFDGISELDRAGRALTSELVAGGRLIAIEFDPDGPRFDPGIPPIERALLDRRRRAAQRGQSTEAGRRLVGLLHAAATPVVAIDSIGLATTHGDPKWDAVLGALERFVAGRRVLEPGHDADDVDGHGAATDGGSLDPDETIGDDVWDAFAKLRRTPHAAVWWHAWLTVGVRDADAVPTRR